MQGILLIIRSSPADEQNLAHLQTLLAAAVPEHPQLANARVIQLPLSSTQIQNWSYWVAAKIFDYWCYLPTPGLSVQAALQKLGLSRTETQDELPLLTHLRTSSLGTELAVDLGFQVGAIRHRYELLRPSHAELQQWLDAEVAKIADWFSYGNEHSAGSEMVQGQTPKAAASDTSATQAGQTGLGQLRLNALAQRQRDQLQLQEILVSWRQSGLQTTLTFLKNLGERLTALYAEFEERRQNYIWRETSAWRAFYNLSAQLQQRPFPGRRRQVDLDAVLQGLKKACCFKLEAEVYAHACRLVGELKKDVHLQSLALIKTNNQLAQLRTRLRQKSGGKPIFAPMLKHHLLQQAEQLYQLRQEIESSVGYPINRWGELSPTQTALVWQRVLALANQFSLEVYAQCATGLNDWSEFQEQSSTLEPHPAPHPKFHTQPGQETPPLESNQTTVSPILNSNIVNPAP